jgi:dihydroorotase-like cyclic amidohydrolase
MSYDLVVRGTVVTASDSFAADIGVRAGRVAAIGQALAPGTTEIAAAGLLVLPGRVDVHTHLDVEVGGVYTADDFESGTVAAACGGITTSCDYAWQSRGQTLMQAIEAWKVKAKGRAHIDYGFHVVVSDATDDTLAEMPRLVAPAIEREGLHDQRFGIATRRCSVSGAARAAGAVVNVHAENEHADHCASGMRAAGAWTRATTRRAGPRWPRPRPRGGPSTTPRWSAPRSTSCTCRARMRSRRSARRAGAASGSGRRRGRSTSP